jgi:hypothetical protein
MNKWEIGYFCKSCDADVGRYASLEKCCPGCGTTVEFPFSWHCEKVRRWHSTEVWYKPWTWGTGHWEYKA